MIQGFPKSILTLLGESGVAHDVTDPQYLQFLCQCHDKHSIFLLTGIFIQSRWAADSDPDLDCIKMIPMSFKQ